MALRYSPRPANHARQALDDAHGDAADERRPEIAEEADQRRRERRHDQQAQARKFGERCGAMSISAKAVTRRSSPHTSSDRPLHRGCRSIPPPSAARTARADCRPACVRLRNRFAASVNSSASASVATEAIVTSTPARRNAEPRIRLGNCADAGRR